MISFLYVEFRKLLMNWRWALSVLVLVLLWLVMIADFAKGYAFNMTESVDGKIFRIRNDLPVKRGSVVIFEWHDPTLPEGVEHMTKRVMCLPGDTLKRDGLIFYCNGRRITVAKTETFAGTPLIAFDWQSGVVPDGSFFAATAHPDGYDSRYYGFVPLASATVLERML